MFQYGYPGSVSQFFVRVGQGDDFPLAALNDNLYLASALPVGGNWQVHAAVGAHRVFDIDGAIILEAMESAHGPENHKEEYRAGDESGYRGDEGVALVLLQRGDSSPAETDEEGADRPDGEESKVSIRGFHLEFAIGNIERAADEGQHELDEHNQARRERDAVEYFFIASQRDPPFSHLVPPA